jgi:hypothetical protein
MLLPSTRKGIQNGRSIGRDKDEWVGGDNELNLNFFNLRHFWYFQVKKSRRG